MSSSSLKDVLHFWFDGADDASRNVAHTRWFVADRTAAQSALDDHVRERFGSLLERAAAGEFDRCAEASAHDALALIVLCDQLSRHVYRGDAERVASFDVRGLALAQRCLELQFERALTTSEFVFMLMPLRHAARRHDAALLRRVVDLVEERAARDAAHADLLARFRRTTLRRLYDAELQQWSAAGVDESDEAAVDESILERPYRRCDEAALASERLYRTVDHFLAAHKTPASATVCVSLSGGVDSMVLCFLCTRLRAKHGIARVVGAHIDYGNRPESGAESDYVRRWCEREGVEFRVRHITEMQRATANRDDYERETRRLRFAFYSDVMAEFGDIDGVIFGHHAGDVRENVISNAMRGASALELSGMVAAGLNSGVMIWRPALQHEKADIFDVAHRFGVPYFKDTTPNWSTRGKMRRKLQPLLLDMYGAGYERNLTQLARETDQLRTLVYASVLRPFFAATSVSAVAVWFDFAAHAHQPASFWREIFKIVCHKLLGEGMLREDTIMGQIFAPHERHDAARPYWLPLRDTITALRSGTSLTLFRRSTLPALCNATRLRAAPTHRTFALGEQVDEGVWRIDARRIPRAAAPADAVAVADVLRGRLSYTLPLAKTYAVTPKADVKCLRALDARLRSALPLVDVHEADDDDGDGSDSAEVVLVTISTGDGIVRPATETIDLSGAAPSESALE
jgi:tRNA(Ile)-lysidine synthetase-like protein